MKKYQAAGEDSREGGGEGVGLSVGLWPGPGQRRAEAQA